MSVAVAVMSGLALVGGCVSNSPADGQTILETAPQATVAAYTAAGPDAAGVTTLQLFDRKVEVWYPADAASVSGSTERADAREWLGPDLRSQVPSTLDLSWDTGAYRNAAPTGAEHPLVLNVHGFYLSRLASARLAAHLASWGFVVAAPDMTEYYGPTLETGLPGGDPQASLAGVLAALGTANTAPGGVLSGHLDLSNLAVMGHSFGAVVTTQFAATPGVDMFINLAAGTIPFPLFPTVAQGGALKDSMWLASRNDIKRSADSLPNVADQTAGPREIAVLDDGGHIAAYTDLCLVGGDSGGHGLVAQLATVGLDLGDFSATADDGCVTSAAVQAAATDVVHHFLTAGLRWHLGVDRLPVGLGLGVTAVLPAAVSYSHRP